MTKVTARVHPVHLMNVDWAPGGRQPSDQASRLGLWDRRKLAAIIHIHHRYCYYYSAVSWYSFSVPRRMEGGRPSRPRHCSKGAQPVPKAVYCSGCGDEHNCPQCDSNPGRLTPQSDALTTRPLRPAMTGEKLLAALHSKSGSINTPPEWSSSSSSSACPWRLRWCDYRLPTFGPCCMTNALPEYNHGNHSQDLVLSSCITSFTHCLQCFDAVGWAAGRASGP